MSSRIVLPLPKHEWSATRPKKTLPVNVCFQRCHPVQLGSVPSAKMHFPQVHGHELLAQRLVPAGLPSSGQGVSRLFHAEGQIYEEKGYIYIYIIYKDGYIKVKKKTRRNKATLLQ